MTRAEALAELIANTENGIWIPETKAHVWELNTDLLWKAHKGSLDAALALHEAVLPGWEWSVDRDGASVWIENPLIGPFQCEGHAARAWLLAILKVLHAQEPTP